MTISSTLNIKTLSITASSSATHIESFKFYVNGWAKGTVAGQSSASYSCTLDNLYSSVTVKVEALDYMGTVIETGSATVSQTGTYVLTIYHKCGDTVLSSNSYNVTANSTVSISSYKKTITDYTYSSCDPSTVTMTSVQSGSCYYTYTPPSYTITLAASPSYGGTVSGGGTKTSGSTGTISATPSGGYTWSSWSDGGAQSHTVTWNSTRTITAYFKAIPVYTVAFNAGAGGSVSPTSISVLSGTTYSTSNNVMTFSDGTKVTATAGSGYNFGEWESTSGTVTSSFTIRVSFIAIPKYTVTLVASPSSGGTVSGGGTKTSGSTGTITATPSSNYNFSYWSDGGAQSHTVKWDSNKTITAYFTLKTYSLTVNVSAGTKYVDVTVSGSTERITSSKTYTGIQPDAQITIYGEHSAGYYFEGFNYSKNGGTTYTTTDNPFSFYLDGNYVVTHSTAQYQQKTITVKVSPSGGGTVTKTSFKVPVYSTIVKDENYIEVYDAEGQYWTDLACTPASDYEFVEWDTPGISPSIQSDKTWTAKFQLKPTYTITFDPNGGYWSTGTAPTPISGKMGESKTLPYLATARHDDDTRTWTSTYTVTFDGNGGTSSTGTGTITYTGKTPYTCDAWNIAGEIFKPGTSYTFKAFSATALVRWNKGEETVTSSDGGVSKATSTRTGYEFSGWFTAKIGGEEITEWPYKPGKTSTLYAHWTELCKLTVIATEGGTVSGGGTYAKNTLHTITAKENEGYSFNYWLDPDGAQIKTNPYEIYLDSNQTYTAYFKKNTVDITVIKSGEGSVTVNGEEYTSTVTVDKGSIVQLKATAADKYKFKYWYINGEEIPTSTYSYTATSDKEIFVYFKFQIDKFNWSKTIAAGQPITNLTKEDWLAIQDKIDEVKGTAYTDWTRAERYKPLTAAMFNQVRGRISLLPGKGAITTEKAQYQQIKASFFDGDGGDSDDSIRAALNRAIDYKNT